MNITKTLRERRLELGIHQVELAKAIGLKSASDVCRRETGSRQWYVSEVEKAAKFLGIEIELKIPEASPLCMRCNGTGGIMRKNLHTLKMEWYYCPDCLVQDKCPNCGKENTIEWENTEALNCNECDWEDHTL